VRALSALSRVVTTSSTLPVLGNILVKTDEGRLKFSVTDLGMGINYWLGAKVENEGEITIPARVFSDYINNNNDDQINIDVDGQMITMTSEHYATKINGLSADEFPIIPELQDEARVEVGVDELRDAVTKVVFAAAIGETNPTLAGVLFKSEANQLKVVATDGYRLAEKVIKLKKEVESEFAVIVPTKTMQELGRLLNMVEGVAKILVSENQIMFKMEGIEVISRLVEGNYPAYESIMPVSYVTKMTVSCKDLLRDVKMAAVFSRETQKIRLMIDAEKKTLTTTARGQSGENESKMTVEVEGKDGEIIFNTKYLSDVLNVAASDKIVLELTDKLKAGLIRVMNDENYRYIIMPVKD